MTDWKDVSERKTVRNFLFLDMGPRVASGEVNDPQQSI